MIWIALPTVIVAFYARGYFARLIFKSENSDIALIFGALCTAIFFRTMYTIISRFYYAQKDTKTPLFVSIASIALNVFLAYKLSRTYGVIGLAIAQSIVAVFEVVILLAIMVKRDRKLFNTKFINAVVQIFSVSGFTVLATYIAVNILPLNPTDRGVTIMAKLTIIATIGLGAHVAVSYAFGVEEVAPVINKVRKIILRPVKF